MLFNILASAVVCLASATTAATPHFENEISVTPSYSATDYTAGTAHNIINLNGRWQVKLPGDKRWRNASVPGELAMQGYSVKHGETVTYRRIIKVPADFTDKKAILRFDGAYSYATLRVNGKKVRYHRGGFSRWDTDITHYIRPGRDNTIELDLTDPVEEISYASGYAHHPVLGILRGVNLMAQPREFMTDLRIDATLDSLYTDGTIDISFDSDASDGRTLDITLTAPDGRMTLSTSRSVAMGCNTIKIPVANPAKWDAEHPRLHTLRLQWIRNGVAEASVTKRIGFRNIIVDGNRLLVNGRPVKLRGACRHDIHPTLGRATDRATDSIDARLFKVANMNFVRTSHYPPSEDFVEFCDRYGIYVESETAVCFVDTYRQENYAPGASENDSTHTAQYIGQLSEMAKTFQSHPSVIMWSIGNESVYGSNFAREYDWIKRYDPSRPVIFSYPGTVTDSTSIRPYQILSMHYPPVSGNMTQFGIPVRNFGHNDYPVLHDEWAHPACYTFATLRTDPGIREFWGQSLDKMWSGVMTSQGALGGAIWGYVDEVFPLPEPSVGDDYWKEFALTQKPEGFRGNCVGYGEWGIVDIFRRQKPEFWATKKAYSPVRIEAPSQLDVLSYTDIMLPISNRFDHTYLSELSATIDFKGNTEAIDMPAITPHESGFMRLPAREWAAGDSLRLAFTTSEGDTVDSYIFTIGAPERFKPEPIAASPLKIAETDSLITIIGSGFAIPFSRSTGLISDATANGETLICSGPYLNAYINYNHLTGAEVRSIASFMQTSADDWSLSGFNVRLIPSGDALATITGSYDDLNVEYRVVITPGGDINIDYNMTGAPDGYLRETGLSFTVNDNLATLDWDRNGYWDSYPCEAMSGNRGKRPIYNTYPERYGSKPMQPWAADTKNFYYWSDAGTDATRPLTNWAKSMKENIYLYRISLGSGCNLSVTSADGNIACRLNKPDGKTLTLYADNRWDYPEIAWGNYCKVESPLPFTGRITLSLRP